MRETRGQSDTLRERAAPTNLNKNGRWGARRVSCRLSPVPVSTAKHVCFRQGNGPTDIKQVVRHRNQFSSIWLPIFILFFSLQQNGWDADPKICDLPAVHKSEPRSAGTCPQTSVAHHTHQVVVTASAISLVGARNNCTCAP